MRCLYPSARCAIRGNAEAQIRKYLVAEKRYIKGIIGLPANLFFGTGIPACIILIEKSEASNRKGVFMIDAKFGFMKDGAKNRLREQDIRRIVDVWQTQRDVPHFARFVPMEEIERNDYNLNIPRYISAPGHRNFARHRRSICMVDCLRHDIEQLFRLLAGLSLFTRRSFPTACLSHGIFHVEMRIVGRARYNYGQHRFP